MSGQVIMPNVMSTDISSYIKIIDFGIKEYSEILDLQTNLFQEIIEKKKSGESFTEYVLIGEHTPVITAGRHAKESNILVPEYILQQRNVSVFKIGRGGDVTYHYPGQLIAYPIIDLQNHGLGVKKYVDILEETVIRVLKNYGIKGERVEGATGVWIEPSNKNARKISAIGVKCSHFCTMHGLSFNVTGDLSGFKMINPCGFTDKGVTSLSEEFNQIVDVEKVKKEFLDVFLSLIFPLQKVFDLPEKL